MALALFGGATACGKDQAAGPQVASLAAPDTAGPGAGESAAEAPEELTAEERDTILRDFAQCMRDHGIDMPDPQVVEQDGSGGGGVGVIIGGPGAAPIDKDTMDAAQKECEPIMAKLGQEGPGRIDPEEEARMREGALAFSKCMREHGVDMPDPQFDSSGNGGFSVSIGGEADGAAPTGPSPDDPVFQEAQKACQDVLGANGPGFTVGGPGGGPTAGVVTGGGPVPAGPGADSSDGGK